MNLENVMSNSDNNIKKIIQLMQNDESVDAPADAIKWSKNIFRSRITAPEKSVFEKVLAVLQIDLSPNKLVTGERSTSAVKARQMLFDAGENSVDVRIFEEENGWTIKGQVLGENFENSSVKIGGFETTSNNLSEFVFENLSKGIYDLQIINNSKEITLKEIEIG